MGVIRSGCCVVAFVAVGCAVGVPALAAHQEGRLGQATGLSASEPLAGTWSVTSYRLDWFGFGASAVPVLPFRDQVTCPPASIPSVVGGIASANGSGARVGATCTAGGAALAFEMPVTSGWATDQLPSGTYAGSIDLLPDDEEKGQVALTVLRKDWWPVPLLVLWFGILIALGVIRQTGRLSRLSELTEETHALEGSADHAGREFTRLSAGRSWSGTTLDGVATHAERLRDRIRALRRGIGPLEGNDPQVSGIEEDLTAFRQVVEDWPRMHEQLLALQQALDAVRAVGRLPALLGPATDLTAGRTVDIGDVATTTGEVLAATQLATDWIADSKALDRADREIETIRRNLDDLDATPEERGQYAEATAAARGARGALQETTTLDDYRDRRVAENVLRARLLLDGLSRLRPTPDIGGPGEPEAGSDPEPDVTPPAERAAQVRRRRQALNGLVVAALVLFATWTGMVALYVDKPFGTPVDYVTILLWGLGAQAALTALVSAADNLTGKRMVAP